MKSLTFLLFTIPSIIQCQNISSIGKLDSLKGFKEFAFYSTLSDYSNYSPKSIKTTDEGATAYSIDTYQGNLGSFEISNVKLFFIENKLLKVTVDINGGRDEVQNFLDANFGKPTYPLDYPNNLYPNLSANFPYTTWIGKINRLEHYYHIATSNYDINVHQLQFSVNNYENILDKSFKKQASSNYSDFSETREPIRNITSKDTSIITYNYQTEIKDQIFNETKDFNLYIFKNKIGGFEGQSYLSISLGKNKTRGYLILTYTPSKILQTQEFPYGTVTIYTNKGSKISCVERNLNSQQTVNGYKQGTSVYYLTFAELNILLNEGVNSIYFGLASSQNQQYITKQTLTDLKFYFK